MFRFLSSWTEFANLMSQNNVLIFRVDMLRFSNLTGVFVGKLRSEDVVSCDMVELEDSHNQ